MLPDRVPARQRATADVTLPAVREKSRRPCRSGAPPLDARV